jgi:ABC-type transporter Mla maintaining outer membrane lipid asymmetry ATPase subunit MlaF
VLHGVDLDVYRGEIFVLLGGSGSGKTTLLKQVLALGKPDAGTISVTGTDITSCSAYELAAVRRRVGVAFQGSALFNSMTIRPVFHESHRPPDCSLDAREGSESTAAVTGVGAKRR